MNLDNVELLTTDEIEERIVNTRTAIENIGYRVEVLMRSPGISDKECNKQIKEESKDLEKLKIDFKAYQTALNADPFDYE
jgi:hypothetical protein